MTMSTALRSRVLSAVLGLSCLTAPVLQAQTKVYPYPGDPSWFPMGPSWNLLNPIDNAARITGARPFDLANGDNGSLQLNITGGALTEPGFFDWGFYGTLSGESSWGRLGDISALSLNWRREGLAVSAASGDPWAAQTPVLRLLLGDDSGLLLGELVWEKFYTDNAYVTDYNTWTFEDLLTQNFWENSGSGSISVGPNGAYVNNYFGGTQYLVNQGCQHQTYPEQPDDQSQTNWNGGLVIGTVGQWSDLNFCSTALVNAYIWGLAVGVGSRWPGPYEGYVDYVRLGFEGEEDDAVYANFELPMTPVPEPGTVALLATGLLGLGGAQLLRRRKKS
jgi:hypothetical protein